MTLAISSLMLLGAVIESMAENADAQMYPPPGQMIDVGGYRLHLHCVGTGSPTVVIDAGLGDWSATWSSWVQPGVARSTNVCTYDRAGMGYSETGPLPRTSAQFAIELHTLMDRADIPRPYVLVGHSSGGLLVRVFAHEYTSDVAGVVLIDSMNPKSAKPSAEGLATAAQGSDVNIDWLLTLPARLGLLRLLAGPLDLKAGLSSDAANPYAAFSVTTRYVQTTLDESRGMPESLAQAGIVKTLGTVPLIVLSRGLDSTEDWQRMQTDLLQLSSNSIQRIADQSGHSVQIDQPEAAVSAVVLLVEEMRRQARQ
ncbi:MAG: alpha/beta fold hydrolase [Chloroflexota bacterium]